MADTLVCGDDHIEFDFGSRQQLAIIDFTPAHFVGSGNGMAFQGVTERGRSTVVEKYPHVEA